MVHVPRVAGKAMPEQQRREQIACSVRDACKPRSRELPGLRRIAHDIGEAISGCGNRRCCNEVSANRVGGNISLPSIADGLSRQPLQFEAVGRHDVSKGNEPLPDCPGDGVRHIEPARVVTQYRVAQIKDIAAGLGDPIEFVALVPIEGGVTGEERLEAAGLLFREEDGKMFVDDVAFDSPAQAAGLDWDQEVVRVLKPVAQPTKYLMYLPALLVLALIVYLQRGRNARAPRKPATA